MNFDVSEPFLSESGIHFSPFFISFFEVRNKEISAIFKV